MRLEGRITAESASPIWRSALETLDRNPQSRIVIDASRVEYVDIVGLALLFDLKRRRRAPGAEVEVHALAPAFASLIDRPGVLGLEPLRDRLPMGALERVGRATAQQLDDLRSLVQFCRACLRSLLRARSQRVIRLADILEVATENGTKAVPIVLLVGFLIGVIAAFELGLVARQLGATIFVVNGVGVAILRELGALVTAIVVAGRTGAAFAAQLGAQKVNEEIDALSTFGIDPIEFLVVPRLIATTLMLPLLTVLADVIGILGGALVLSRFDITLLQFYTQLLTVVAPPDFVLGLVKAALFGWTIALIGCHRGLTTGAGAIAVGQSATHAVVTSIVMIIVIDGIVAALTS